MKKAFALLSVLCLAAALFAGCGGSASPSSNTYQPPQTQAPQTQPPYQNDYEPERTAAPAPSIVGTWTCGDYGFDVGAMSLYPDGKLEITMNHVYTGSYKKSGSIYEFEITGGKSSVSAALAKEQNRSYKITAELNADDTVTVHIKAKSGYIYYGKESATFKRY